MKYCKSCKAEVRPVKKKPFKWGAFFMWGLCFGIGALVYAGIHFMRRRKYCPVHGVKVISIKKAKKLGFIQDEARNEL